MVIRNDRPTTPKPTTTPAKTEGPTPTSTTADVNGTSDVDGAEDIEDIAQMSLVDGQTIERGGRAAAAQAPQPSSSVLVDGIARTDDPASISALLEQKIGSLAPGESLKFGGAIKSTALPVLVEAGVELEIKRNKDGTYEAKVTREGQLGLAIDNELGEIGEASASIGLTGSNEIVFKASTLKEATGLGAELIGAAVAGAVIPMGSDAASVAVVAVNEGNVKSARWAVGMGLEAEVETKLDDVIKSAGGVGGSASIGIVFEPPNYFIEVEAEAKGEVGNTLGFQNAEVTAFGGEGAGTVTLRIPLTDTSPHQLLQGGENGLSAQIDRKLGKATVTVEYEGAVKSVAGDVTITATKTVPVANIGNLKTATGWEVEAGIAVGATISGDIGIGEVEVGTQIGVVAYSSENGSVAEAEAAVKAKDEEIKKRAEKEAPLEVRKSP